MLQSLFGMRLQRAGHSPDAIVQMTAEELRERLERDEQLVLVDVRTPGEYQAEHIPGARLLPLSRLQQRSDELPRERSIVCICRSGARSQVACEQLARHGFDDVANLAGGMIAWKRAERALRPEGGRR